MGASSSTRKITLYNDDKAGVIKLSESLAHRLRGQIESDRASDRETYESSSSTHSLPIPATPPVSQYSLPPSPPPTPPQQDVETSQQYISSPLPSDARPDEIPAWSVYAAEAQLLASRLREEKELELKLKDDEWRMRIKEREKEYTEMAKLSESHLAATVKEVEGLFLKVSCTSVCQEQQAKVMKCYSDNPTQTLRCADEVENFARCVDLSRLQSFMKERATS